MNTKHKALLLTLCAALLVSVSVFGTIAYFTDMEAVQNTFTVGSVGITLDETKVNQDGTAATPAARVDANHYRLLPGHTYIKDPTVTVDADSVEAYVRMMVTVTFADALDDAALATSLDDIFTGYDGSKWIRNNKAVSLDKKTITYEYRYYTTVNGESGELEPLFTQIVVPGGYDNAQMAMLDGMTIDVVAHAIQAPGFQDADAAWNAFAQQQ